MLEPEYFSDKADRMIEIYQELEDFIFKDIAGRLLESQSVSGTADRLIWKLEQMGESRAEILKKLSQITRLSRRELQAILQDAVMTSWQDDLDTFNVLGKNITNPLDNDVVRAVMDAEYRKSQGELHNLTRTTMDKANQDLIRMLDEVDVRVASGVQSYSAAVCDILDNYAGKGFEIEYPSGTKRTLEAAVRMCVVTSMNQTSAQITNQYIVEGGIEYVLVSAHVGARPQQKGQPYLSGHENWQGKVYRIRGSEPGFPNLAEMTGYDIDAQGNGRVVDPRGLHGYNCRHSHKPWDKRLRNPYVDENGNPKIDTEKNRKLYEAQQKQRAMERAVRKTKRELLMKQEEINRVAETDVKEMLQPEYDRLAHKLHQQNEAYNKFCEEKGLQRQSDRLKIVGFKRKQAAQARGRARAYEHWQEKQIEVSATIEREELPRKPTVGDYGVDWSKVQSGEFRSSLEKLSGNAKTIDAIETRAKWALNNRDGMNTEELYAIDLENGTEIARIANQSEPFAVRRTEGFTEMLNHADELNRKVLLIHNHPRDLPPSLSDVNALLRNKNVAGITIGHGGSVYYYSRPNVMIPEIDYNVAMRHFKGYTEVKAMEKTMQLLSLKYGFEFKKL